MKSVIMALLNFPYFCSKHLLTTDNISLFLFYLQYISVMCHPPFGNMTLPNFPYFLLKVTFDTL